MLVTGAGAGSGSGSGGDVCLWKTFVDKSAAIFAYVYMVRRFFPLHVSLLLLLIFYVFVDTFYFPLWETKCSKCVIIEVKLRHHVEVERPKAEIRRILPLQRKYSTAVDFQVFSMARREPPFQVVPRKLPNSCVHGLSRHFSLCFPFFHFLSCSRSLSLFLSVFLLPHTLDVCVHHLHQTFTCCDSVYHTWYRLYVNLNQ